MILLNKVRLKVRRILIVPALLALLLVPFLVLGRAHAVSKTWDGGCGIDTSWSCANNWSDNIVPGAGDTVTFDATSTNDSVVDASFAGTVANININGGYTGMISLSRSLTASASFVQSAGIFTAGNQTLTIGTLLVAGGSFTASSGNTNITGDFIISGSPTFNANSGFIVFRGSNGATLACGNVAFSQVIIEKTNFINTFTVGSDCNLPLGANPVITGTIELDGTLSGSGTLTKGLGSGVLTLGSSGALSGFSGLSATSLVIDGTYDFGNYNPFIVDGAFTLHAGGSFIAPSGTASFDNNFTISSGATFNANGGIVEFNGTADAFISCGNATFNQVEFTYTGGTKSVGSDCNLPLGNNPTVGTASGRGPNGMDGTAATGFGSGGGGAGYYGGMGGNGLYGGGGGGAAGYTASNRVGGTSGAGMAVFSPVGGTDEVRTSGNTYIVPAGVTSIKIWSVGAGGGGAGATDDDSSSGGAGGAGGVAYKTFTVVPGQVITYSLGVAGLGGTDTNNGSSGGGTTVTVGATIITGGGGAGGEYNTGNAAAGGSFSGGDGGATGGTGSGASGDTGGGGGGGIGGADGIDNGASGGTGGQANDVSGLFAVLSSLSYPTVGPGVGGTDGSGDPAAVLDLQGTVSGSGTLTVPGNLSINGGGMSGFNGLTVGQNTVVSSLIDFSSYNAFLLNTLEVAPGGDLIMPTGGATVTSTFNLDPGGSLTAPSGTAYFGGSFLNNNGTFNANGGTVILNSDTDQFLEGNTTFYNLTKISSSAHTLFFGYGSTQTILGRLTLQGAAGNLLRLASSAGIPGYPWFIDALGTTNVSYVDVSDSDASGGKTIVACGSVDSGGNSNWIFNPSSCTPPPPVPPTPTPTPTPGPGTGGLTAVVNFELLQAALLNKNAASQQARSPIFPDNGLPSKIQDFLRQFPQGKGLVKAAWQFLWALLAILALLILIGLFLLWRRRKQQEEEPPLAEANPVDITTRFTWPPPGTPGAGTPGMPVVGSPQTGTIIRPKGHNL